MAVSPKIHGKRTAEAIGKAADRVRRKHCPAEVAVIGGLRQGEEGLIRLLTQAGLNAEHFESLRDVQCRPIRRTFALVILTQAVEPAAIQAYRHKMSSSKIVYLSGRLSTTDEIMLRSLGLIFLGSYNRFEEKCAAILQDALCGKSSS